MFQYVENQPKRFLGAVTLLCVLVIFCRSVASGPVAPAAPAPAGGSGLDWNKRTQWEVTLDEDGVYRAYYVQHVSPEQLIVTVSATEEERDWDEWLLWGSKGAASRLSYVIERASGRILKRYDHASGRCVVPGPGVSRFLKMGRTVASGEGIVAPGRPLIEKLAIEQRLWSGFYADPQKVSTPLCPARFGLRLNYLGVGSCADLAGMQAGDILVRISPWDYNHKVLTSYIELGNGIAGRFLVGDPVELQYLRPLPEGGYKLLKAKVAFPGIPVTNREPEPALLRFEREWQARKQPPEKGLLATMAAQTNRTADNDDLMARLALTEKTTDAYRLAAVRTAHKHPFLMESVAAYHVNRLPRPCTARISEQVAWLDDIFLTNASQKPGQIAVRDYRGKDLEAHLDYIEDLLRAAAHYRQEAFKGFSEQEKEFIQQQAAPLLEGFVAAHMMCFDRNLARQRNNVELLKIAHRLDMEALLRQGLTLARIVDSGFLTSLKRLMAASPNATGRIATRKTQWGTIILGGRADDRYLKESDAAVIIELAGDDFYANNTGSSVPGAIPSAVLVDFEGDDHYENWKHMRQGCGFMGVGILLDCAGEDSYVGIRCCQGAGFMGIGILADMDGNDSYRAIDYGQGVGQFGAGFLLDERGQNRYEGHQLCQGVGLAWGVGLLYSGDPDGDDSYYNKGQHASGYADAGSFEGWGQGLGVGHRPFASGGIGVLVDEGGNDDYQGGTFSLGGGYYYGMGILNDRGNGADRYRGSRYNIGFTAHQAVGIFIDEGGDDHYLTTHYVAMGMAWDESCTLFIDRCGDDTYVAPSFAFGAAAMNGFALFIDADGSDRYVGSKPARVYGNSYHKGTSIGYFLDLGKGKDVFGGSRKEGEISAEDDHAFFVDGLSLTDALERLRKNPLMPDTQ